MDPSDTFDRLMRLNQWLHETTVSTPHDSTLHQAQLAEHLAWLDAMMPEQSEGSLEHIYALHLRAVAEWRLSQTRNDEIESWQHVERAMADSLLAVDLARQGALRGQGGMRRAVTECLSRLMVSAVAAGTIQPSALSRVETLVADCLGLADSADSRAVAIAARMSTSLAMSVLTEEGTPQSAIAEETSRRCTAWFRRARTLAADPARSLDAEAAIQLAIASLQSLSARVRVISAPATELRAVIDIAAESWMELERMRALGEDRLPEIPSSDWLSLETAMRSEVLVAMNEARNELLSLAGGELDRVAELVVLRPALHALPEALWKRTDDARQILDRLLTPSSVASILQDDLDRLEVGILKAMLMTLTVAPLGLRLDELTEETVDTPEFSLAHRMALSMMFELTPRPSSSYLACALTNYDDHDAVQALDVLESDLDNVNPRVFEAEDVDDVFRQVLRFWWSLANATDEAIVAGLMSMFGAAIEDEPEGADASLRRLASHWRAVALIEGVARITPANRSSLQQVLNLVRNAALNASAPDLSAMYAAAEADLLYVLAQTDETQFRQLVDAASRVTAYVEAAPEGSLSLPSSALVRCYRYVAVSLVVESTRPADTAPKFVARSGLQISEIIQRLKQLSKDPSLHAEDRFLAAQSVSEIELMAGDDRTDRSGAFLSDELLDLRPTFYLSAVVQGDPHVPLERGKVEQAWDAMLRHIRLAGRVGLQQRTLEYFAGREAVVALQLAPHQRLALAGVAFETYDPTSVESAQRAIYIASTIQDLAGAADFELEVQPLLERYADRFLPKAISDGLATPEVVLFMLSRVAAGLNFGAACRSEFDHRTGVAIAAHLLAVAQQDATLAAWSAYYVEEMARHYGSALLAKKWASVYISWRRRGGMNEPEFRSTVEAIRYDLDRLEDQLSRSSGDT